MPRKSKNDTPLRSRATQEYSEDEGYLKSKKSQQTSQAQTSAYTIDDVMEKLLDMEEKYNNLFKKYEEQVKENFKLKDEITEIKMLLNRSEQKLLNKNLIVHGIPEGKNEDIKQIIENVGSKLEVDLTNSEFTAYRIGKENEKKKPIKVCFINESDKNMLIKARNRHNLSAKTLGYKGEGKVFLNHDLTKYNLELYKKSLLFKKNNNYKYLWFNNGNILLRKEEDSVVRVIKKEDDLK